MTKNLEYDKAVKMRKEGKSYSDILSQVHVSKSTLSRWLQNIPLSSDAIIRLNSVKKMKIERYRNTMNTQREEKLRGYYNDAKKIIYPLSSRELYLAGLFLYWGEGSKTVRHTVSINNTDPSLVQFALKWYIQSLKIPRNKIKVMLHLYTDMDKSREMTYWSKILEIPLSQFLNPHIKQSLRRELSQKSFGHGTCGLMAYDTIVKEKILMALKVISDQSKKEMSFI